ELDKDPASAAHQKAQGLLLQARAQTIGSANPKEQRETLDAVKNHLAGKEIVIDDLRLAMGVARALEYGNSTELAADAYASFSELAAKSKDAQIAGTAEMFHGAGRRLGLIGNEMELKGSTVDGKEFDLASLKGKVVLVDFWATWCGPCLAEYPNILQNFEDYHDKGFEVVGVSLDADRAALEKYVEEKEVPWTTLHDKEAEGRHPAATYYGILGIPAVILVDKEGNVVSLNARGPELGRLLAEKLGPVETKEEAKE